MSPLTHSKRRLVKPCPCTGPACRCIPIFTALQFHLSSFPQTAHTPKAPSFQWFIPSKFPCQFPFELSIIILTLWFLTDQGKKVLSYPSFERLRQTHGLLEVIPTVLSCQVLPLLNKCLPGLLLVRPKRMVTLRRLGTPSSVVELLCLTSSVVDKRGSSADSGTLGRPDLGQKELRECCPEPQLAVSVVLSPGSSAAFPGDGLLGKCSCFPRGSWDGLCASLSTMLAS